MNTSNERPDITIVLCSYQRAEMLRRAVASLFDLNRAGLFTYEILVIDNASRDHTQQVIEEAKTLSHAPVRGIYESRQGIAPARNRGVKEARGEWIAFFDDDQLADENWLLELMLFARQHGVKAVGGNVHLLLTSGESRDLKPLVRMLLGESRWSNTPRQYAGKVNPGCGNMMVHRSIFEEVGVFDESISGRGEDTDLYRRIVARGHAFWYVPSAIVHHLTPPERLKREYLFKLATHIGEQVARNERSDYSWTTFLLRVCAKRGRRDLVYLPAKWLAMWRGDHEMTLDRECQLKIEDSYLAKAKNLLWPSHRKLPRKVALQVEVPQPARTREAVVAKVSTESPLSQASKTVSAEPLASAPKFPPIVMGEGGLPLGEMSNSSPKQY